MKGEIVEVMAEAKVEKETAGVRGGGGEKFDIEIANRRMEDHLT